MGADPKPGSKRRDGRVAEGSMMRFLIHILKGYRPDRSMGRASVLFTGHVLIFLGIIFLSLSPAWSGDKDAKVSNPSKFKVKVSLPKVGSKSQSQSGAFGAKGFSSGDIEASIAVNILDARFYPVKTYVVRKVKKKEQIQSLWDGRDIYGREAPAGNYYAVLSITYSDGTKETKFYKFEKE